MVDEVFPHAPETIWKTLTTGELIGRWLMAPTGFEPVKGKRFTFQTKAGRRLGRRHSLPGAGGDPERALRLRLEGRARGQRRLRRAAGHRRHLDPLQGRRRHAPAPGPFRLRHAEERVRASRPWAKAGRRSSRTSAPSPTSRTDRRNRRDRSSRRENERRLYRRMRLRRDPLRDLRPSRSSMNDCQCRDCQQTSGTGHGSYLTFPRARR